MRRSFAAPFVLTFACGHAGPPPPSAETLAHPDRSWSVHRFDDGTCEAEEHDDCDEERDGHTCNPPEPTVYPCVGDTVVQVGADCWSGTRHVVCPDDVPQPTESAPEHPDWLDAPGY
jgi:hypothetical protein